MPILELKSVSKSFGEEPARTRVLKDATLSVEEGEFVAIVGFSGSGKTTLINLMAGLIAPDSGEVLFKGKPVKEPGPERGVVFQSYSLMPWLSVRGNVALAVDAAFSGKPAKERRARVDRYTEMVGLAPRRGAQARRALRRHAPARGGGARACHGPGSAAARRAAVGARCAHPRQAAGRDRSNLVAGKEDGGDDHQRCRRGDPARRPHRAARPGAGRELRTGIPRAVRAPARSRRHEQQPRLQEAARRHHPISHRRRRAAPGDRHGRARAAQHRAGAVRPGARRAPTRRPPIRPSRTVTSSSTRCARCIRHRTARSPWSTVSTC